MQGQMIQSRIVDLIKQKIPDITRTSALAFFLPYLRSSLIFNLLFSELRFEYGLLAQHIFI
ncbi:hypothetical protein DU68_17490 [Methanosarcina mazei]|uniref:Uncharacterized protein n=1 Tax=Methanosarcina mazei TaxID=2209 RepID=A0A0F8IIJ7_METMZ|nr:hypothetical protein DU33_18825 [Methanosarcina mazei]KKG61346.1 hypothetical protein DU45_05980 [Methanosarcina mazei]KKG63283.1 hypothetical protein DU64_09415 [Methanosarcina mazei]KKG95232.1 hypothetical protein DU66_16155 [Methanosarcina mazei]KKG97344.1 hypothetical protein DU68_17490 [Methanosarcina mazei]